MIKQIEEKKKAKLLQAQEQDRALFDFDEEINNLAEVEERYPVQPLPTVVEPEKPPVEEKKVNIPKRF